MGPVKGFRMVYNFPKTNRSLAQKLPFKFIESEISGKRPKKSLKNIKPWAINPFGIDFACPRLYPAMPYYHEAIFTLRDPTRGLDAHISLSRPFFHEPDICYQNLRPLVFPTPLTNLPYDCSLETLTASRSVCLLSLATVS